MAYPKTSLSGKNETDLWKLLRHHELAIGIRQDLLASVDVAEGEVKWIIDIWERKTYLGESSFNRPRWSLKHLIFNSIILAWTTIRDEQSSLVVIDEIYLEESFRYISVVKSSTKHVLRVNGFIESAFETLSFWILISDFIMFAIHSKLSISGITLIIGFVNLVKFMQPWFYWPCVVPMRWVFLRKCKLEREWTLLKARVIDECE